MKISKRFRQLFFATHRLLGSLLSLLFLMWFLTGFVMLYRTFPSVSDTDRLHYAEPLNINELDSALSDSVLLPKLQSEGLQSLTIGSYFGQPFLSTTTADGQIQTLLNGDSLPRPTSEQIHEVARTWCSSPIAKIDTLWRLEQWIPFSKLRKDFPIYKFYFDDGQQIYISSVNGNVLQKTDKASRFWSYVGAIPHWIYFTFLRQDRDLWERVVVPLAGVGVLVCLTGLVVGILSLRRHKKTGRLTSPYKRGVYRWHQLSGFAFGLFVTTFIFSGMMSLADVPETLVKVHNSSSSELFQHASPKGLRFATNHTDLWRTSHQPIKKIEWTAFANEIPIVKVTAGDTTYYFDASSEKPKQLNINVESLKKIASRTHTAFQIDTLREYDNYYGSPGRNMPLPVYKVSFSDADANVFYIDPATGTAKHYNSNKKAQHFSYQVLHRFSFGALVKHETLRKTLMWITLLGGTVVSATGVWLGVRYLLRRRKK